MKKRKIVIISGLSTSGKTTTSHELAKVLPDWVFIDIWKIKEMFEPLGLESRKDLINISKKAIITITREVMRKMKRNIILQEAKSDFVKKYFRKELVNNNYQIYSFYLRTSYKDAVKRDTKREKPIMNIGKTFSEKEWDEIVKRKVKRGDIVINTSDKNPKQVVNLILQEIGEKPKKHPNIKSLRKSW